MTRFLATASRRTWLPLLLICLLWATPALTAAAGDGATTVNSFIPLMVALGIILLASRTGGAIARRLNQPRVLGQLIIGVLLGPTLLDMLHWDVLQGVDLSHTIKELAELGVLLLMFNIGLEVHLSELAKVGKSSRLRWSAWRPRAHRLDPAGGPAGRLRLAARALRRRHPGRDIRQQSRRKCCSSSAICAPKKATPCWPPR